MDELNKYVYTVYCKHNLQITLLNKAFKSEITAYQYALIKIKQLLSIINEEFKESVNGILPLGAQVIYFLFQQKSYDDIEQYEYFKENYKDFFKYILREPTMFFISRLEIIDSI